MPGTLYLVATPIGNLQDITLRALETLASVDLIACEDTRVSSKLLAAHHISKTLRALHQHTSEEQLNRLITELKQGSSVAYVSDAGTPNMNDPGGKLVERAFEEGFSVVPIPGASVLTVAISACGFPMEDFVYRGFAPHKKGRQTFFRDVAEETRPSVFLESTHRIEKTLDALVETLSPERLLFVGRELTKMHETLYRGTATDVKSRVLQTSTKGEFILIVGPEKKA